MTSVLRYSLVYKLTVLYNILSSIWAVSTHKEEYQLESMIHSTHKAEYPLESMIQSQSQQQNNKNTLWVHCNEAEKRAILA